MSNFYAVEIVTVDGPVISRYFTKISAARKWATWCRKTWPARIMKGGAGGMEVQ
jgi:hypothetical protein